MYIYEAENKKKIKKWVDGFVACKNKRIVLYDENKRFIYNATSYKVEDCTIDVPLYLIYTSHIDDVMTVVNKPEELCCEDVPVQKEYCTSKNSYLNMSNDEKSVFIDKKVFDKHDTIDKLDGRSFDDIIGLFKKE